MLKAIEESKDANLPSDELSILQQIQIEEAIPNVSKDFFKESPMIGSQDTWQRFIIEKLGPHLVGAKMIFNARKDGWKAKDFH